MFKRSALAVLVAVLGCGDNRVPELPPEVSSANIEMAMSENGTLSIDASAIDPEDRPLAYAATAPAHGTLSGTAPHYTYTPDPGFTGTDAFTITVSNRAASVDIPVRITVNRVDVAPVADDQQVSTRSYLPVAITLGASDVDSESLSYAIVAAPAHGALTGTAPEVTYTPAGGFYGTDSFTFVASDGALSSNVATVAIQVSRCGVGVVDLGLGCAAIAR
jgi:hypothetical protein